MHFCLVRLRELIETLWNVNLTGNSTLSLPFSELIETLWNVNLDESDWEVLQKRINRNIVECK